MFVKLLSIADLVAFIFTLFYAVHFLPASAIRFVAFYLLIKGGIFALFFRDFASAVDFIFGLYFLAVWLGWFSSIFITAVAALWLLQKSLFGVL